MYKFLFIIYLFIHPSIYIYIYVHAFIVGEDSIIYQNKKSLNLYVIMLDNYLNFART